LHLFGGPLKLDGWRVAELLALKRDPNILAATLARSA
jgi:hypothetical protein